MSSKVDQFLSESGGNNFTETAPRPPVPGEENEKESNGGMSTKSSASSHKSHVSHTSARSNSSNKGDINPATPRKSINDKNNTSMSCSLQGCDDEMDAPLGFEPEGSAANSPPFTENSTPPCSRWAKSLHMLLDDRDGVTLFKTFLNQEGIGTFSLDFWFLCRGLKLKESVEDNSQVIRAIYKKYIKCDKLPYLDSETKRKIVDQMQSGIMDSCIFNAAQGEVEQYMASDAYPAFLKSDLYIQYFARGGDSSNSSSGSNSARPVSSGPLPTLREDHELEQGDFVPPLNMGPPLSKSFTRSSTCDSRRQEVFSGPSPYTPRPLPYHNSYAPTSAQDSELQSLSSTDALTDDTRSLTDSSVWMHEEARRINLPDQGMTGGIIIDEMSIQQNLEILKNGDIVELVGFEDMGEEGSMCATLRKGHQEKVLGTHILQFMFLGITGFRFPFAHFVSTNVQSYDLHRLFWEAVTWLKMYGFSARYISLDGAQSNRTFMNMNIGKNPSSMVCENPSPYDPSVVFIMDPKHVIKKIRNNVIKSGNTDGSTRLLTLPNGSTIQWKMWVNAFEWDRSNALQLHQRLTQEHIFPNSQAKMRNKLAEDVLNLEMLNLMVQYRASLTNSTVLDGAVEFLKNTSKIISIFQDKTPVLSSFDERLNTLIDISKWFDSWSEGHQQKDKNKLLISSQCLEDIKSCLIGFVELCKLVLVKKEYRIVPAMINSDIIENHFCQHRATYNGANSNPTALQYRRNLNSIILGQNIVSQKSSAGILAAHATKLSFTNTHKRPRAESTCKSDFKNLKIIRM